MIRFFDFSVVIRIQIGFCIRLNGFGKILAQRMVFGIIDLQALVFGDFEFVLMNADKDGVVKLRRKADTLN